MLTRKKEPKFQKARQLVSALLVAWILLLNLAAVSPTIHEWLHPGADCASLCEHAEETSSEESEAHSCAVLILQNGAQETPPLSVSSQVSYQSVAYSSSDEVSPTIGVEYSRPARAPPIKVIA